MHSCSRWICGLLFAGLLNLCAGGPMLQAQTLVSFSFTAEIINLVNEHENIDVNAVVGDKINGSLMFDPNLRPRDNNQASGYYDFGSSGSNRLLLQVGGVEFVSGTGTRRTPNEMSGFVGLLRTRDFFGFDEAGNRRPQCSRSMKFSSNVIDITTDSPIDDEEYSMMSLHFDHDDCIRELDVSRLPSDIILDEWNSAVVQLLVTNGQGRGFSLYARLTSISNSTIKGGVVHGNVFSDYNGDCELNAMETHLANRIVRFTPGSYLAPTNEAGDFQITLPLGEYEAEVVDRPFWSEACQTGPSPIVLTDNSDEIEVNFGMQADELVEFANVSLMSSRAGPGFQLSYRIFVHNVGTLPYNGKVRFRHDDLLTDFNSWPQADSYTAPVAEWEVVDLAIDGTYIIDIATTVPPDDKLLGEIVCAHVSVEKNAKVEDQVLLSNQDGVCQEIRGSYDPNDIQVFAGTRNADGAILQDDRVLNYLIRFQNEGNESAITVRVVDELSEYHNIEKLVIGAASHDFEFDFNSDGALEWTFNDIDLVPKSVDEAASQGFIKFQVHLQDELAVGTEIPNKAAIYFDFNSPVITNTVVSRITSVTTSVEDDIFDASVSVYPNPTIDNATIQFAENTAAELTLRNPLGEVVLTQTIQHSRYELDLRALAAGSYYLTIKTNQGTAVKPISVVR